MDKDIYNLLRNLTSTRRQNNLSKKEMCKIMKIGLATLNKIESGIFPERFGANSLIRVSQYFNVTLKDLFM